MTTREDSMSQTLYDTLKRDIIKNKLKPGEQLVEMNISNKYKVSRTPVREALRQLEQEGLVRSFPRRGCFVTEISIKDALELYEVREYLEGLAMKHICLNIRRIDIKTLEDIVNNMDISLKNQDYDSLYNLHAAWTKMIVDFTVNTYLKLLLGNIYDRLTRLRGVSLIDNTHNKDAFIETKNILEAIKLGDENECEKLAMVHVRNAKKRFMQNIKGSEYFSSNLEGVTK